MILNLQLKYYAQQLYNLPQYDSISHREKRCTDVTINNLHVRATNLFRSTLIDLIKLTLNTKKINVGRLLLT